MEGEDVGRDERGVVEGLKGEGGTNVEACSPWTKEVSHKTCACAVRRIMSSTTNVNEHVAGMCLLLST